MNNNGEVIVIQRPYSGYATFLTVLFITLKLCGFINWSWWWVLSPAWITLAAILLAATVIVTILHIKG